MISMTLMAGGCCCAPPAKATPDTTLSRQDGLEALLPLAPVNAWVDPPIGWRRDKFDVDAKHAHVTWVSPSGDTAYGVVMMNLPFPVGPDMVLWGFLSHMQASDKRADLVSKHRAPDLPGLRFEAESGLYRIRVNLTVHNWQAWAVYAGTVLTKPENAAELALAEKSRDHTQVAMPTETAGTR